MKDTPFMLLTTLHEKGLIQPPKFLHDNTAFLCRMGSEVYGASLGQGSSDVDIIGYALPRKEDVFPFSSGGYIFGFGNTPSPFQQWSQHKVKDGNKEYDLTVYSIVKFLHLAMTSSPSHLEALFAPRRAIIHSTAVSNLIVENRHLFLSKKSMNKLRGYAFSQMAKIEDKANASNPKRAATIAEFGYDTKFAYHTVRLCLQAEQILEEQDLTLDRNSQMLLSIRRGEWSLDQLKAWFDTKVSALELTHARSTLRDTPDEEAIKALLMQCLEQHYGNLSAVIQRQTDADKVLRDMQAVIDRYA
jgi:uncharacterized protein